MGKACLTSQVMGYDNFLAGKTDTKYAKSLI